MLFLMLFLMLAPDAADAAAISGYKMIVNFSTI